MKTSTAPVDITVGGAQRWVNRLFGSWIPVCERYFRFSFWAQISQPQDIQDTGLWCSGPDVAQAQLVEMARTGGSGLAGNRRSVSVGRVLRCYQTSRMIKTGFVCWFCPVLSADFFPGDAVLVRWSDGHWYAGHVRDAGEEISVAWDPPYAQWAPERVSEQAVIPRMNQPREVCNFDVALEFVTFGRTKICHYSTLHES